MLPFAIRYNGTQPTKLSVWPKYEAHCCAAKYDKACRILDLPCARKEQAKDVLADAVLALGKDIGIDMNFASLVPDPALYESKMEELAYLAYEDQHTSVKPREPLVEDVIPIMKNATKGNKWKPLICPSASEALAT